MSVRNYLVFLILTATGSTHASDGPDYYSEIGARCIATTEPQACLSANGFSCFRSERPRLTMDAFSLACNASLQDGRKHFVQLLHANGGWNIEMQKTYMPEHSDASNEPQDPDTTLSELLQIQMQGFSSFSSGPGIVEDSNILIQTEIGTRWLGLRLDVGAACGDLSASTSDPDAYENALQVCEQRMLRAIQKLSQKGRESPYAVASPSEIRWTRSLMTLSTGEDAIIVKGSYTFPEGHSACRDTNDCCDRDGSVYLGSCRVPTLSERDAINACLTRGLGGRAVLPQCLTDAGIRVGCETQADGSKICY